MLHFVMQNSFYTESHRNQKGNLILSVAMLANINIAPSQHPILECILPCIRNFEHDIGQQRENEIYLVSWRNFRLGNSDPDSILVT